MFKKLKDHLITKYPLLWNTRFIPVAIALVIIHLLFFMAGFAEITVDTIKNYYSLTGVTSGGLLTFSILCSLGVIILWLVFYLRNNAFKNFYIIEKFHSVREFCLITIIILFSIVFFESFRLGAMLKTRTITNQEQLVKEVNIVNLARAFIPQSKADYFILEDCEENPRYTGHTYNEGYDYFDTSMSNYNDSNYAVIRNALQQKQAFSYKNYCGNSITLRKYRNFLPSSQWVRVKNKWIDERRTDSIRYILDECVRICKKYGIAQNINTAELTALVFKDSFYNVTKTIPFSEYDYTTRSTPVTYFDAHDLNRVLYFVDECHLNSTGSDSQMDFFTVEFYFALCFSILLLCYRLYSKRVFLISIIGAIVWLIFFALLGVSSSDGDGLAAFYLVLFILFLVIAFISLKGGDNKVLTGVLLNWHVYMLPFVVMVIVMLITNSYDNHRYSDLLPGYTRTDAELKSMYPVGYWVSENEGLIFRLNLLFVFLYTAFFFTRLSKKWHILPEE